MKLSPSIISLCMLGCAFILAAHFEPGNIALRLAAAEQPEQTVTDFEKDVTTTEKTSQPNIAAQIIKQEIQQQDYTTSWDQQGMNPIVSGVSSMQDMAQSIAQDIQSSDVMHQSIASSEQEYLSSTNSNEQDVLSIEESATNEIQEQTLRASPADTAETQDQYPLDQTNTTTTGQIDAIPSPDATPSDTPTDTPIPTDTIPSNP